jgi:hypothetical protein
MLRLTGGWGYQVYQLLMLRSKHGFQPPNDGGIM